MNKSIIFFDSNSNLINPNDDVFINKNIVELFIENDMSLDEELTEIITNNLLNDHFTNIVIPVCFGEVLSDFLGLRLATHIKCTPGINQLSNVFLYSFTGIQDYFSNECFNILKTKGVFLIDYSIDSMLKSITIDKKHLSKEGLVNEVKKLKMDVPLNYEDSHSITNEWAIYRWANTINTTDTAITRIGNKLDVDLYYKYLKTIYPLNEFESLNSNELKLNFEGKPTILYIDDEAEKGWREIFEKILMDENDTEFFHLDNEFNEKTKKEIVEISLNQVIEEDVDLVILDFRLHKEDFENVPLQEITGYQILKGIKEINKGIQVIIFSATNKVWNLQALQDAKADGFILKESPENSNDLSFTKQSIENMIHLLGNCLNRTFLKGIYESIQSIQSHINSISNNTGGLGLDEGLLKIRLKNEIFIQLDIIYDCLNKSSENISTEIQDENSYLNLSFISIYKLVELINDYFTDETGRKLKSNSISVQRYNQNSQEFSRILEGYPSARDKIYTIIKFELDDAPGNYVQELNKFNNYRKNIIHPRSLKDYKKTSKEDNGDFLTILRDIILLIN
jgi:DNA-binding NarL/FixJ family response regulator